MSSHHTSCLAVTLGEVAGVGPDLILTLWSQRTKLNLPPFLVVGDHQELASRAHLLAEQLGHIPLASATHQSATRLFSEALPIMDIGTGGSCAPGVPDVGHASYVIRSIETATNLVLNGKCHALVTAPIQKSILVESGFEFQGHTDFLGALARQAGHDAKAVMMLACEALKVVPLTVHQSLASVTNDVTEDLIIQTTQIVHDAMQNQFGIQTPRIAIAALNPHAGENGAMGNEDDEIVQPAITMLKANGIAVTGPHPADTLFHAKARETYDVVIAMYHDQALIPIKTIAFDRAVNVTLGLPFVRTSPDHGTALDLAGTGKADPTSFLQAINLAEKLARQQQAAS